MSALVVTFLSSTIGAIMGCLLACIPALHVYNVLGLAALAAHALNSGTWQSPEIVVPWTTGMIVGWAMGNTIPSVLLSAPDESAVLTVLPGQKYAMAGRGFEAVMMTSAGGLGGLCVLVCIVGPLAPRVMPVVRCMFRDHTHWVLWTVIAFLLMSEWPKFGTRGQGGWRKFLRGWSSTGAGLFTFGMSGLLGFVLQYRSPVDVTMAFQNLMPAFVGLFAVPWLILNLVSRAELPRQRADTALRMDMELLLTGTGSGALGGMFAAFFPGVTGGIGGLLAGHATAQRDERCFLVAQGASKVVYYVGALLLFFIPGQTLARGGGALLLRGLYTPRTTYDFYMCLASIAIAGAVAFLLMVPLTRAAVRLLQRVSYRRISLASLAIVVSLVVWTTGIMGLLVMGVAAAIGLIPVLFHSRRLNCLGVILLPMACSMSGYGGRIAEWLGLA